jgi:anti-sigma factor RsiW
MPDLDEQEVRSYLLGNLSPKRAAELQALLQDDSDLRELLLAVEAELFDQYAAGGLSREEEQKFETHLLNAADGQQKLRFARLFRQYTNMPEPVASPASPCVPAHHTPIPESSRLFTAFNRNPAFTVIMIVIAGLLVTLIGWLIVMKLPAQQSAAKSSASETPVVRLAPGSMTRSGDGIRHLHTPAQNVDLKLELELPKSDFKKYRTQLFRENEALESQEELKTQPFNTHYVVPVTVTGEILKPGDYQMKLSGVLESGKPEFIDSYSFRVTSDQSSDSERERGRLVR